MEECLQAKDHAISPCRAWDTGKTRHLFRIVGVGEDGVCSLYAEKVRVEQEDQVEVTEVVIGWWENDVTSTQVEKWKEGGSQSQELGEESDEKKASVLRMQENVTEVLKEALRSQTPAS